MFRHHRKSLSLRRFPSVKVIGVRIAFAMIIFAVHDGDLTLYFADSAHDLQQIWSSCVPTGRCPNFRGAIQAISHGTGDFARFIAPNQPVGFSFKMGVIVWASTLQAATRIMLLMLQTYVANLVCSRSEPLELWWADVLSIIACHCIRRAESHAVQSTCWRSS